MSVQSEINRIKNAKTAIKTAISNKGVSVPADTKIDGIAPLIDSIQVGGGGTGGGGSTAQTCTVTINLPANVAIFGWGERDVYVNGSYAATATLPSTNIGTHRLNFASTQVFKNMPIGTTFTFYYESSTIKGVTCSDTIEFGFANHKITNMNAYNFAVCRVNGDGEITITV